ncbi:MAG: phage tail protein [Anaerolineales bacterium]|nr:phage tail protein [Anaerolineales bacterium]
MAESFVGEIRIFGGTFAPMDWAFCDGATLSIAQYDVLFSLIGTTYGGDGVNNFNLPDLRGRVPVHMGTRDGVNYIIGQAGGQETVALQANQAAAHTHPVRAKDGSGDKSTPAGNVWATVPGTNYYSVDPPALAMRNTAGGGGNGAAHDNVMPFFVVNFIICLAGVYPTRL